MLLFQRMTRRYEHASTLLTSNKGFEEWGEISLHTAPDPEPAARRRRARQEAPTP